MKLIFLRHGEATDNVKEVISDREIYWSTLTDEGKKTVLESIESLDGRIDKMYVSPFPRTIQTAHYVFEKFPDTQVIIENRLHEINNGKFSGKKNCEELDNTRIKQIDGDYFVRFGDYGENKYDIEDRLTKFLIDVYNKNLKDNTIMIVSHGSITSYMKRLLNIKTAHIKTGKLEVFEDVDFSYLFKYRRRLDCIKKEIIESRLDKLNSIDISLKLKNNIGKLIKNEFNNIEFDDSFFNEYFDGLATKNLNIVSESKFDNSTILICFYSDVANFADKWINHYINIGIKNFVLVDNNSSDESSNIFKKYSKDVNISFWNLDEKYNCYKMCGWKQLIMEYYGINKKYITVDSDELLVYSGYKKKSFEDFITNKKNKPFTTYMLDVYTKDGLYKGKLEDYKYVDKGTYSINENVCYGRRVFGGPRSRVFGIHPSLQKVPFINYTGKELFINDHFYYPFSINDNFSDDIYLLHYKFLPNDEEKYKTYALDHRHWNNSREYIIYNDANEKGKNINFYDKNISIKIDELEL